MMKTTDIKFDILKFNTLKRLLSIVFIAISLLFCITQKTNAKETFNIVYTTESKEIVQTLISLNSILYNNTKKNDYVFYIIESDISEKDLKKIENYIIKRGAKVTFLHFDIDEHPIFKELYEKNNKVRNFTPTYIERLYLPKFLPNLSKCLYFDNDIIVNEDLSTLYNIDISKYSAAMVEETDMKSFNESYKKYPFYKVKQFYNAGVILFNLDKCREQHFTDKALKYLQDNPLVFTLKPYSPTQNVINKILDGDILSLNENFNIRKFLYFENQEAYRGIIHYTDKKPWKRFDNNIKTYIYYAYWKKSGLLFSLHKLIFKIFTQCYLESNDLFN